MKQPLLHTGATWPQKSEGSTTRICDRASVPLHTFYTPVVELSALPPSCAGCLSLLHRLLLMPLPG